MIKATINGGQELTIESEKGKPNKGTLNGNAFDLDAVELQPGSYSVIHNNVSYTVDVLDEDAEEKTYSIRVNGTTYKVGIKDRFDLLLKNLGMDNMASKVVKEVKAPMPGMVLNILVEPGSIVKKGDPLLVLEAMKMENVLKSPTDGVVKSVAAKMSTAVEKNQLLVQFN